MFWQRKSILNNTQSFERKAIKKSIKRKKTRLILKIVIFLQLDYRLQISELRT